MVEHVEVRARLTVMAHTLFGPNLSDRIDRPWLGRTVAVVSRLRWSGPILTIAYHGQFVPAYQLTAWLCWVPNVLFVEWIIRRAWRPQFAPPERFAAT